MGIPVGNIFAFFTTEDPNDKDCEQVELHEDLVNGTLEFHFESGRIIPIMSNLKEKCPEHRCPHYVTNPAVYNPQVDPCEDCLSKALDKRYS